MASGTLMSICWKEVYLTRRTKRGKSMPVDSTGRNPHPLLPGEKSWQKERQVQFAGSNFPIEGFQVRATYVILSEQGKIDEGAL